MKSLNGAGSGGVDSLRMLKKALVGIPSPMSKDDWNALPLFLKFLVLCRAVVLIITLFSCVVACALVYVETKTFGPSELLNGVIVTFGMLFAHAANNILNDCIDFYKGVDSKSYYRVRYGFHGLSQRLVTLREAIAYAAFSGMLALCAALYFVIIHNDRWLVFKLAAAGSFFVVFYTWPLKYLGLGEPSVLIVWGYLMMGGVCSMVTNSAFNTRYVIAGLPYSLGVTSIIFGKHIDKLEEDEGKSIYTMPVLMGSTLSRYFLAFLSLAQYVLTLLLVVFNYLPKWSLICALSSPTCIKCIGYFLSSKPKAKEEIDDKNLRLVWPNYYVAIAFAHNRIFGFLFILGLLMSIII